ncbi:MAG: copper resistance protein NlpE [Spirochaetaceae bacterium]|jgi:uncharacterized lipoprotein NlpE involved in copper resistance|nr:copper resistance protein NlpE [Spirochaetaceae bacterium]
MKRFICIAISAAVLAFLGSCGSGGKTKEPEPEEQAVDVVHNTRNSVDWAGVYNGVTPAADGPGIDVTIELYNDETFALTYVYVDREGDPFTLSGTFSWDDTGNRIALNTEESLPTQYIVGENTLIQLDMEGNVITGDLADMYILKKMP